MSTNKPVGGAQFTPGPWYPHLAKADHCLSSSVWGAEPGNQVAVIGGKSLQTMNTPTGEVTICGPEGDEHICTMDGNEDYQANGNLIAAAPAMYEALSEFVKYLREQVADEALDTWAPVFKAAMALAQAEGRQG